MHQDHTLTIPAQQHPARLGRFVVLAAGLALILALLGILALRTGPIANLTTGQVLEIIFTDGGEKLPRLVVRELRLPRVLLGMLIGAAMALVGVLLQDSMRNVLAEPGLLGTSSGAVLVVAAVTILDLAVPSGWLPVLAFGGGLAAGGVLLVATTLKMPPIRLILVGAALNALLNSLLIVLISLGEPIDIQLLYRYMVGSLSNRTWDSVHMVLPWLAAGIPLALLMGRPLNLLKLGDDMAESLGLPVLRARVVILAVSTAMVSAAVAVAGPISFIALLAPHGARRALQTPDARLVLPVAALIGAVLLTGADLLARQIFHPVEMPVGLFTIILGAPVLLILLRREIGR